MNRTCAYCEYFTASDDNCPEFLADTSKRTAG